MKKWVLVIAGLFVASTALTQTLTIDSVLEIAKSLGVFQVEAHPYLEKTEADEAGNIMNTAKVMFALQMAQEPQSRDAHAKGHACAAATMTIESNIPMELQAGLFANPGATYQAIIRYSNGSGLTQTDVSPDGRGMAVKVIDGAKDGNILGTGTTQDFMMINNPRFFVRSIRDYALFQTILTQLKPGELPTKFFLIRAIREALTESGAVDGEIYPDADLMKIAGGLVAAQADPLTLPKFSQTLGELFGLKAPQVGASLLGKMKALQSGQAPLELRIAGELRTVPGSMIAEPYFSMVSFLARSKKDQSTDTAVKYVARPVNCADGVVVQRVPAPQKPTENFLAEELVASLNAKDICYNFYLQPLPAGVSEAKRKELVEDSRLDYGTAEVLVAKIKMPAQNAGVASKQTYCENLSYNPWQASPELQPLGGMNRARKVAVTASSIRRHMVTGADRKEPVSVDEFKNLK